MQKNMLKLKILFNKHSKVLINIADSKKKAGNNDHKRINEFWRSGVVERKKLKFVFLKILIKQSNL